MEQEDEQMVIEASKANHINEGFLTKTFSTQDLMKAKLHPQ